MSTQTFSPEPSIIATFPTKRPALRILQPEVTYTGSSIQPLQNGLPKQTESLCPECNRVILADIFAEDGKVMMEKSCAEHGIFRDIVFSDIELYLKMEEWNFGDNLGLSNPQIEGGKSCPDDCGLCGMHTSHTALANVDLTNRCNLTCPVCFANANVAGYLYEPSIEQLRAMLQTLARRTACGRTRGAVLRRRAHHPSAVLRNSEHGAGDGLHPHPGRDQRHRAGRSGIRAARRKPPDWQRSTCNSTASPMTSIAAPAGKRCSRPR